MSFSYIQNPTSLSPIELFHSILNTDNADRILSLISDNMEQITLFNHFMSINQTIQRLEDETEKQQREAEQIFEWLSRRGFIAKIKPFIRDKRIVPYQPYIRIPLQRNEVDSSSSSSSSSDVSHISISPLWQRTSTKSSSEEFPRQKSLSPHSLTYPSSYEMAKTSSSRSVSISAPLGSQTNPILLDDHDTREVPTSQIKCDWCNLHGHIAARCPKSGEYQLSPRGTWCTPGRRIVRKRSPKA